MAKIYRYKNYDLPVVNEEKEYMDEEDKRITRYDLLVDLNRADGERCRILGAVIKDDVFVGGFLPENIDSKFEKE